MTVHNPSVITFSHAEVGNRSVCLCALDAVKALQQEGQQLDHDSLKQLSRQKCCETEIRANV